MALVVGDEEGRLTAALARVSNMYVQGCDRKEEQAEAARASLLASELADRASFIWLEEPGLPYVDNLINLVIAATWNPANAPLKEILRILAPDGLAVIGVPSSLPAEQVAKEAASAGR
ncbi:MAG: hypothetical protein ACUVWX_13505 [Kiritimatiellia bacterium]